MVSQHNTGALVISCRLAFRHTTRELGRLVCQAAHHKGLVYRLFEDQGFYLLPSFGIDIWSYHLLTLSLFLEVIALTISLSHIFQNPMLLTLGASAGLRGTRWHYGQRAASHAPFTTTTPPAGRGSDFGRSALRLLVCENLSATRQIRRRELLLCLLCMLGAGKSKARNRTKCHLKTRMSQPSFPHTLSFQGAYGIG